MGPYTRPDPGAVGANRPTYISYILVIETYLSYERIVHFVSHLWHYLVEASIVISWAWVDVGEVNLKLVLGGIERSRTKL